MVYRRVFMLLIFATALLWAGWPATGHAQETIEQSLAMADEFEGRYLMMYLDRKGTQDPLNPFPAFGIGIRQWMGQIGFYAGGGIGLTAGETAEELDDDPQSQDPGLIGSLNVDFGIMAGKAVDRTKIFGELTVGSATKLREGDDDILIHTGIGVGLEFMIADDLLLTANLIHVGGAFLKRSGNSSENGFRAFFAPGAALSYRFNKNL